MAQVDGQSGTLGWKSDQEQRFNFSAMEFCALHCAALTLHWCVLHMLKISWNSVTLKLAPQSRDLQTGEGNLCCC